MLPLDDPRRPKYWMQETSGILKPVIEKLLTAPADLTERDIAILRMYFQQWVDSPAWDANPHENERSRQALAELRSKARTLKTFREVKDWIATATREGMDPL